MISEDHVTLKPGIMMMKIYTIAHIITKILSNIKIKVENIKF